MNKLFCKRWNIDGNEQQNNKQKKLKKQNVNWPQKIISILTTRFVCVCYSTCQGKKKLMAFFYLVYFSFWREFPFSKIDNDRLAYVFWALKSDLCFVLSDYITYFLETYELNTPDTLCGVSLKSQSIENIRRWEVIEEEIVGYQVVTTVITFFWKAGLLKNWNWRFFRPGSVGNFYFGS